MAENHFHEQSISSLRSRIDEIDTALIELWQERAGLSQEVGKIRISSGGTRLALSRELDRGCPAGDAEGACRESPARPQRSAVLSV
jgi:hypothetical protein